MSTQNNYRTTDIVLAAYLRVLGAELSCIEKVGTKGTFVFVNVPSELLHQYDLGNARVEPTMFHNAIKALTTSVRRT